MEKRKQRKGTKRKKGQKKRTNKNTPLTRRYPAKAGSADHGCAGTDSNTKVSAEKDEAEKIAFSGFQFVSERPEGKKGKAPAGKKEEKGKAPEGKKDEKGKGKK